MWSPLWTSAGLTISAAVTVLSAFTTFTLGKARWICSPIESVLQTVRVGGMPCEKSSGFEASSRIFPSGSALRPVAAHPASRRRSSH